MSNRIREQLDDRMRELRRKFDDQVDYAYRRSHEIMIKAEEIDERLTEPEPPTDEQVDRFRDYVMNHSAVPQWQTLIYYVNRGSLTWRKIVEEMRGGTTNKDIYVALKVLMSSGVPQLELEAMGVIADLSHQRSAAPEAEHEQQAHVDEPEPPSYDNSSPFFDHVDDDELPPSWRG